MRALVIMIPLFAACADQEEPARLDHAQILAVRVTPAHVAPGGRAKIDVLAGDDAGTVFETAPDRVTSSLVVEHADDGWYVTAGATPGAAPLDVALAIDGVTWRAEKQLVIAAPADNPRVAAMQVDGADATSLVADAGTKPALAARGEGAEPLSYAWYSSAGDLEHYRTSAATLDADAPADGTIVVVVRDAVGGVAWQTLPAQVQ